MGRAPAIEYFSQRRPDTLLILTKGYETPEIANNCGSMLRDSIKYEPLASVILYDERFWKFFDYVQGGSFDVSSDAFATFKVPPSLFLAVQPLLTAVTGSLDQA